MEAYFGYGALAIAVAASIFFGGYKVGQNNPKFKLTDLVKMAQDKAEEAQKELASVTKMLTGK